MNTKKIPVLFLLFLIRIANGQETDIKENPEKAQADYRIGYTIGNYMLWPVQKTICVGRMCGTATEDAFGFFPDSTLIYDRDAMIIFGGIAFFDKSNLDIDWESVQLLFNKPGYAEFTDGETLYYVRDGEIREAGRYNKNTYKLNTEKRLPYRSPVPVSREQLKSLSENRPKNELTEGFYIKENTFYSYNYPVSETFDVPNLHIIVSKSGFETYYITDGRQVIYGGGKTGYTTTKKDGKEYILAKRWMVEGVDLSSLRVLGRDLLVDKNALYYQENRIPFDQLCELKFIIREL